MKILLEIKLLLQVKSNFDLVFPKYKKGGYIVCKVIVDPIYRKCIVIFYDILHCTMAVFDQNTVDPR